MVADKLETAYPVDLIEMILQVCGAAGICHEIMRDEDYQYVERVLRNDIFAYFDQSDFRGKKILDFGCGSGASTMILARMFPESEITGIELVPEAVAVAKRRAEFYGYRNLNFLQCPSEKDLPEQLGQFDFVILSAVYEHLLPNERKALMPRLWASIRDGGFMFINQTPNQIFPFELHTTGMPLINYLPDKITFNLARSLSPRVRRDQSWNDLLREGIRGATEKEILRNLSREGGKPQILEPKNGGLKDRIDLYYKNTGPRHKGLKTLARYVIRAIRAVSGLIIIPDLSLAFHKVANDDPRRSTSQPSIT